MVGEKNTSPVVLIMAEINRITAEQLHSFGFVINKEIKIMTSESNAQSEIDKVIKLTKTPLVYAVDTEFENSHTLSIQAARRRSNDVVEIQIYRSPSVPKPHVLKEVKRNILGEESKYISFLKRLVLHPVKAITKDLSPATLLIDFERLAHANPISLSEGKKLLSDSSANFQHAEWDDKRKTWKVPVITIKIIGHYLYADIARVFGSKFNNSIFGNDKSTPSGIRLRDNGTLSYRLGKGSRQAPVVQYLQIYKDFICGIRIETCDLRLPFNSATLGKHSQTFLGFGKAADITTDDKQRMSKTFEMKTDETYKYAAVDALNTLLIYEQMTLRDREIYETFKVPVERIPEFKGTCGRRVSDFLLTMASLCSKGSDQLSKKPKLIQLVKGGGFGRFSVRNSVSRYGEQTARVYGGLGMSRSPTQFWHKAPRMLRDIDMSGCYNQIICKINMYLGQPIVLEPGSNNMALAMAVAFLEKVSPNDGWFIKVTGDFTVTNNVLIPSATDAVTFENYRSRRSKAENAATSPYTELE